MTGASSGRHLQTLELGYVAQRAAPYLGPLGGLLTKTVRALGLSRLTDAVILVVSEETGEVSLALNGRLHHGMPLERVGPLTLRSPSRWDGLRRWVRSLVAQ